MLRLTRPSSAKPASSASAAEQHETSKRLAHAQEAKAAAEEALAEREARCKALEVQNDRALEAIKQREADLARTASLPKKSPAMDPLSMQVLARATATALLKYGISQKSGQQVEAAAAAQ